MNGRGKEDISKVGDHNKANVCSGNSKKRECRVMFQVYFIVRLLLQPPKSSRKPLTLFFNQGLNDHHTPWRGIFPGPLLSTAKAKQLPSFMGAVY